LSLLPPLFGRLDSRFRIGWRIALSVALATVYVFLPLGIAGWLGDSQAEFLKEIVPRVLAAILLAGGGMFVLKGIYPHGRWGVYLAGALLLQATITQFLVGENSGLLRYVSDHPFALGWSEASRYYYASLWLGPWVYGEWLPLSVLHPTRYLLQSLAFLIPNAPLWVHRLWQVLLFNGAAFLAAFMLARRLKLDVVRRWMLIGFGALFLLLPPVYYHLLIIPIFVLWGVREQRFWTTLVVVVAASLWAGISRVNWLPMPGLLAAAIYLLERPVHSQSSRVRYFLPPAGWFLASAAAGFLSKTVYPFISGNPVAYFDSSFTSDLLWYRLLPNVTYEPGVLLAGLVYALPLGVTLLASVFPRWRFYDPLRLWGLAALLLGLFGGGLVVSVKIGGGKGLHNLDAFWLLLLVVAAYAWAGRFQEDRAGLADKGLADKGLADKGLVDKGLVDKGLVDKGQRLHGALRVWGGAALALGMIVFYVLDGSAHPPIFDAEQTQQDLAVLQAAVGQASADGGEVLFIRERQLTLFGDIQGPAIVHEYELVFLTEMEMANNSAYLERFYADLRQRRFALIVSDPVSTARQGRLREFGEENDAWAERVAEPLLCYYVVQTEVRNLNTIVLLAPRPVGQSCAGD